MPKFILLLICVLFAAVAQSQNYEKIWFDKTDTVYGYYTVIKPLSARIQATLVLMDGFGGNADAFLPDTKLQNTACANDIMTVCIPTNMRLYADSSMLQLLNKTLSEVVKNYGLKKDRFVLGGFSSGGTILLRYAELCKQHPENYPIIPAAVFTGDSPVDLIALYQSEKKQLQGKSNGWWLNESRMIIETLDKQFGDPVKDKDKYATGSPFNNADTAEGNERFLKDVAYRTYHDMDIAWQIQNRNRSIYETNMLPASELVNRLVLMGNKNTAFMAARQPGMRSNGMRHPHSWSIIDEVELVQWIKEQLHFYPDHLASMYSYNAPANWSPEVIIFPIDFAPALNYKGFEELRFAPGWGDAASKEKWAYTLLWWLDDVYPFNADILQQNLENYFTGLTRRRAVADKLDMNVWTPAKAQVQKTKTWNDDIATYSATLNIFDAQVSKKPGNLYLKVHQKNCGAGRTVLLLEVSAFPFAEAVWTDLDKINARFKCGQQ